MELKQIDSLWSHLHRLVILAEQGSYTAAAARLGVSKAAMSQHISELERVVGVPLVRRTTRSVRLTEAGQRLVDETRLSFARIAESVQGASDQSGTPRGLVRVTAPVALGRQQLVARVAGFLEANPAIRIEMELSDRFASLATEGFDLAIRHAAKAPDTHVAWLLCKTRTVLVASPRYLSAHAHLRAPHDLAGHACLHYPRGADANAWTFEPRTGRGRSAARLTVAIAGPLAANNSEALRDAAQTGLGIALIPDFSAQSALQSGELVEVLPDWTPVGAFADRIWAIRPYAQQVPRAVSLFVRYLRDALEAGFEV
jgi:DNA-binding transcriptional LysR family regulator